MLDPWPLLWECIWFITIPRAGTSYLYFEIYENNRVENQWKQIMGTVMEVDGFATQSPSHICIIIKESQEICQFTRFCFLMIKKERFVVGRYLFLVWNSNPGSCFCLLPSPLFSLYALQVATDTLPFCSFLQNKVPLNEENIENATDWARSLMSLMTHPTPTASLLLLSIQKKPLTEGEGMWQLSHDMHFIGWTSGTWWLMPCIYTWLVDQ